MPEETAVFVADTENGIVRRIDVATNTVETVAGQFGNLAPLKADAGTATSVSIGRPNALSAAASERLFIANGDGGQVLELALSGEALGAIRALPIGVGVVPTGLYYHEFAAGERLFIVDGARARVLVFDLGEETVDIVTGEFEHLVTGREFPSCTQQVLTRLDPFLEIRSIAGSPRPDGGVDLFLGVDGGDLTASGRLTDCPGGPGECFDPSGPLQVLIVRQQLNEFAVIEGVTETVVRGRRKYDIEIDELCDCGDDLPHRSERPFATDFPDLLDISTLTVDPAGRLLFFDPVEGVVRELELTGGTFRRRTVAGTSSDSAVPSDGLDALQTRLAPPSALAVDSLDNLYILDQENGRVRRVWIGVGR